MPFFKLLASFGGHELGHVVVDGRDGSHMLLVSGDVELVWEVALFEFGEPKGFGKRRERNLEETQGIDETDDVLAFHLQEFAPVADLFNLLVVGVVLVQHEIAIVPLNIVSDDVDWARFIQGQGIQPFDKLLHTLISSEAEGTIIVFGFGNHEIGHVVFLGLHGFDVKEHVQGWGFLFVRHRPHYHHCLLLINPQGLKVRGSTLFGGRTTLTSRVFVCVPLFALGFLEG